MILVNFAAFILALSIHEMSHAWVADRLGDPTARIQGRLSLNPLRHIDWLGTVFLPLFLILSGSGFIFGWAKPVMFDPFNLRNPRRDAGRIGLAGPLSNIASAVAAAIFLQLNPFPLLAALISAFVRISVILAVFNLIPIHPLDGGKIIGGILPKDLAYEWEAIQQRWGLILLIFLIFPWTGGTAPIFYLIGPVVQLLLRWLLPISGGVI